MSLILSIDIGTTKLCVLALDAESRQTAALRSCPNASDLPRLPAGRHEQDPLTIRRRILVLLGELLADAAVRGREVAAIGITGQMHGVLLVDAALEPLTPLITWRDARSAEPIASWQAALGPEAPARLGCRLAAGYGGATLAWLRQAGELPGGATALSIAGFVAASLCGVAACDPTHAASWGIYDLHQGIWDKPALAVLGIPPEVLPPLAPSGQVMGTLNAQSQALLGLGSQVRVCAPIGDNQAGVYALGAGQADTLALNLGTGGQISRLQAGFASSAGMETRPMPFGGSIQAGSSLCGGWSYAYLRQFFQGVLREFGGLELDDEDIYARMNALIEKNGAAGLSVDTRFSGSRQEPGVRGALSGIDTRNFTPAALTYAWAEGMIEELVRLAESAGLEGIQRIVAAGNAVRKNPFLAKIIAARFGLPCTISEESEEAALGAAHAAARAVGLA